MNKPEIRSHSNSRKRFSEDLDTHLDPITHIFEEHYLTSLNFKQFKHIIEIIATFEHPLDTIQEYETTENHIFELFETNQTTVNIISIFKPGKDKHSPKGYIPPEHHGQNTRKKIVILVCFGS